MNIRNCLYKRGVGWYLALAFTGLSIMLTLILSEVISYMVTQRIKTSIGERLSQLALQTTDKLDRGMFERYREVRLIAQRPDLVSNDTSRNHKRAVLDALQDTYPFYAWIGMTNLEGQVLVSTKGVLEGANVAQRPWHGNAMRGVYLEDVHNAVLLAKMLPPPADGDPLRFVDIAFPYFDESDSMAGVIATHLSWEWANDIERSIFEPIKQRRHIEALILSQDGTVLLGPDDIRGEKLQLQSVVNAQGGGSSYIVEKWSDGKQYLVGYARSQGYSDYPGLGWTILVRQSVEEAFLPASIQQRQVIWAGIILAVVFCWLGLIASRKISRPLTALATAARRIQEGEAATIPKINSFTELKGLSESLNSLVANLLEKERALRDLNMTLEKRVEIRTEKLRQALATVQASERRVQTIIEAAQDAYVAVDPEGRITGWNTQAEMMFGWSKNEALGKPLHELVIPLRFRDSFLRALRHYDETGQANFLDRRRERFVIDRNGQEFPVEMSAGIVHWDQGWFFTAFLHDISERKEIARMKDEFISTVSHELRTPLTSIRASLAMLDSGMAGEFEPDVKELLHIAYENCERLVRLINDVLDIEKIESGRLQYALVPQTISPLIRQATQAMQAYANQFNIGVEVATNDGDTVIHADGDRIVQVLVNLLSNAIKFSPQGKTVEIRTERMQNQLQIVVSDHGPGIPENFQNRIFQKFAQADSTDSRQKGGTGLGLAICKNIIEGHGGQIGYNNKKSGGAEFFILLPALS